MIKEITGIITFGNIEPAYTKTSFCIKPNSDNINSISPNIASLVKPTRINKMMRLQSLTMSYDITNN